MKKLAGLHHSAGNRRWSKTKRGPGRSWRDSRHNQHKKNMARKARRRGQMQ